MKSKQRRWMRSANENCELIYTQLLAAKNEFEVNCIVRTYHNEIFIHPGLRQILKSTIRRITTKNIMQIIYSEQS